MNSTFACDDKATLIAYLYGEVDAATRASIEAHLESCARCAVEVRALGDVRAELSLWAPPDAKLGFAIVKTSEQPSAQVLRPAQWWRTAPRWAQAAAAVLVLAAGLGIANLQVRSGPDGFTVSTGWMVAPAIEPVSTPREESAEWRTALVSLEQQLRNEIRAARDEPPPAVRASAPAADAATIRRVEQLLAASEDRQARELALRLTQFTYDMNMQRRADLQRITQSFGQFDEQMLRQRQILNNVIRVSASGQQ